MKPEDQKQMVPPQGVEEEQIALSASDFDDLAQALGSAILDIFLEKENESK